MGAMIRTMAVAATFLFLASCAEVTMPEETHTRAHRTTEPTDTAATSSGIRFDMENDSMEEEVEWLEFNAEEWEDEDMNVDL